MKHIAKRMNCAQLDDWRSELIEAEDPNLGYHHPGFPKRAVIAALLEDQGNLCAYTMQRIGPNDCHIEHIKPQTICRDEDRTRKEFGERELIEGIAWSNLLACYPAGPTKKGQKEPGYGARQRGNWWDEEKFLSPLCPDCEERIKFSINGTISSADPSYINAVTTIDKMNLNHESLNEQRKNAITSMGLHPLSEDPMPIDEANLLAEALWNRRLNDGFMAFCVTLRDAAKLYLQSIERQSDFTAD